MILDPRLKTDYYQANRWGKRLIEQSESALVRAMEAYGATEEPQPSQADHVGCMDPVDQEIFQGIKRRRVEGESEMRSYLALGVASPGEDVLGWWKRHTHEYPCLSRLAWDCLDIPSTSVPAERVFPGGTNLITNKRGLLSEDTIRACCV